MTTTLQSDLPKFTQGEWKARPHRRDGLRHGGYWIGTEQHPDLVRLYRDHRSGWCAQSLEEIEANANLISAAPDLLTVLKLIALDRPHHHECTPERRLVDPDPVMGYQCWTCRALKAIAKAEGK